MARPQPEPRPQPQPQPPSGPPPPDPRSRTGEQAAGIDCTAYTRHVRSKDSFEEGARPN